MDIGNKLNSLSREFKENEIKIIEIKKQLNKYLKDKKRAKLEISKNSIQKENIDPIKSQISTLKTKGEFLKMQLLAIESHVLGEELKTRQSGATTVTKLDNKYRLRFLFSRFRRFGNFTGYIAGRKEEADNTIKNYLIKKSIRKYIKDRDITSLYSQLGIDPKSKMAYHKLMDSIISNSLIDFSNLDKDLTNFINKAIANESISSDRADRNKMLKVLRKNVPTNPPNNHLLDLLEKQKLEPEENAK